MIYLEKKIMNSLLEEKRSKYENIKKKIDFIDTTKI